MEIFDTQVATICDFPRRWGWCWEEIVKATKSVVNKLSTVLSGAEWEVLRMVDVSPQGTLTC